MGRAQGTFSGPVSVHSRFVEMLFASLVLNINLMSVLSYREGLSQKRQYQQDKYHRETERHLCLEITFNQCVSELPKNEL